MDVKDDSSPSSAHAQGRLIAVRPNRAPGAASPSDSNPSKPSTADDEDAAWSPPPAPRPDPQGAAKSAAGKSAASRVRKPRQPNNGKSPLFWVHMDQQSVPEGKKEDTLKRIRSHVMSEHNRRKRLESSRRYMNKAWKHLASQPVDTTATAPDQAGSSRVDSQSDIPDSSSTEQEGDGELPLDALGFPTSPATGAASVASDTGALVSRLSPAEASPWPYLGSGSNDPFSMTHTSLSNRMVWHMQYFLHTLTRRAYPFHRRCGPKLQAHWESLIKLDPAPLHACICLASSNSAVETGVFPLEGSKNPWSSALIVDTFHHRGETIRLVNKGLSDPTKASSDALIAAVSVLLTTEIASGNPDYLKIHLAGLRQMVALRQNFPDLQPDIRYQISWTDMRVASMALTKPIFSAVRYARPLQLTVGPPNNDLSATASRLLSLDETRGIFGSAMSQTVYDLLELEWYTEWVKSYPANQEFDDEAEEYFNTEVIYIEYCLHSDRYDEHGREKGDATIEGCVRLACVLFHNTLMWDFYPQMAALIPRPIIALKMALEDTICTGLFSECQDLLIWLLFIGTCSAGILSERSFFKRELDAAVGKHGIENLQQLRETLLPFFYVDRCYLKHVQSVWDELQV